jgi:glycosyltransferase involved in cell wall biosynthesis
VAAVLGGFWRRIGDTRAARRADLVYIHLEVAPIGPPVFERSIRRSGPPIVYDIDDLVYLPHGSSANRFMHWIRRPNKVAELLSMAAEVIVCTPYLETVARRHNDRVTDISSTIDTDRYRPRPHRDTTSQVVLGWSGSHSTAPYLHLLDDTLAALARTHDIVIRVIGEETFEIPGLPVTATPWRLESEVAELSEIDIGVYPLPDEEWILGKSGLKALQYMALEIPTVAQRIGTNLDIIESGTNGLLASDGDEWLEALGRLVEDPELRRTLGRAGRETVIERYSVRSNAPRYLQVLSDALAQER